MNCLFTDIRRIEPRPRRCGPPISGAKRQAPPHRKAPGQSVSVGGMGDEAAP
jgi:hypothetical protein